MTVRKVVSKLHLYTGLAIGLLLVVSGLTGSMLVFREEIETLVYPELMNTVPRDARVSLPMVLETVQHAHPEDKPVFIRMPRSPEQTYLIKMNNAHDLFVYVDPYNGKILGEHRQEDTFTGWIALLHTELLSGERGEIILGVSALLLIGMSITGLILWWPRNGKFSPGFKIQWAAQWKRVNFDIHRASGIYTVLFLLLIAFTGTSLVFNKTVISLINAITQSPPRAAPPLSDPRQIRMPRPALDMMLHQADYILPASTIWINLPQKPTAPLVVRKKFVQEFHPNGRSFVYLDQYSGKVLRVENALTASLGTRIFNTLYPIHIGVIGGTPTRLLQVVIGLSPLILFTTGSVMWWNRRKAKRYHFRLIK
ncbi:MAG: putative iron-regulated membrane protein [Candidatus Nitrotoga sp. CP45]|nr:MAG: putative iron-regulated membrane protein [Candidatus Nitrotoga sp. CP45]